MEDNFNTNVEGQEDQFVSEAQAEEEGQIEAVEEEYDDDGFFEEVEIKIPEDLSQYVTIRTTSGGTDYVKVEEATPLIDIIQMSKLRFVGNFSAWLNGAAIDLSTKVPGGSVVTIIGTQKGG